MRSEKDTVPLRDYLAFMRTLPKDTIIVSDRKAVWPGEITYRDSVLRAKKWAEQQRRV